MGCIKKSLNLQCQEFNSICNVRNDYFFYVPFTQGDDLQSSIFSSHLIPEKPASQLQVKPFNWSRHVPDKRKSKIRINVNKCRCLFIWNECEGFFFGGGGGLSVGREDILWFSLLTPEDVTREPRAVKSNIVITSINVLHVIIFHQV